MVAPQFIELSSLHIFSLIAKYGELQGLNGVFCNLYRIFETGKWSPWPQLTEAPAG